jgi:hypothetical protein
LYASGRNIQVLVDRSQHQQSIGLDSAESRNCWLGIAGSTAAAASGGAVSLASRIVQAGETVSLVGQITLKSATAISSLVNSLGVVNGLGNIIEKAVNKDEVTSLDIFQFTSSVLFFTNSVISTYQAQYLIGSIGENSTGGLRGGMNQIQEFVGRARSGMTGPNTCIDLTNYVIGCSSILSYVGQETLCGICKWVCRQLIVITKSLLKGCMAVCEYIKEGARLLQSFWEKWNEEVTDVVSTICTEFGVKHWSDILIRGLRVLQCSDSGYIRKVCGAVIAETGSFRNFETAVQLPEQNQVSSEGNDVGANSFVRDEIINIHAKFADLQMCKTAVDFYKYMKFVCKFVKNEFEKEKLNYEKQWKMIQELSPHVNVEDFDKHYGISGNKNSYFFQQVFNKFKDGEKEGLFWLKFAYDCQKAVTSAQEESGQSFYENDGVIFHSFWNKAGLASNGMLSEEQYHVIAAELTKQHADKGNVVLTVEGITAVMLVNCGEYVVIVNSYLEDGKVSGIAAMLHSRRNSEK